MKPEIDDVEILNANILDTLATDLMSSECDEQCEVEYQRLMPDKRDYVRRFQRARPMLQHAGLVW